MSSGNVNSAFNTRAIRMAALVFVSFFCFYALLRSNNILAVDGAHRSLEVYRHQSIHFHANNHMLYPVNVLAWSRCAAAFGFRSNGPLQFYSTTELMNCFAGAACLAILYLLMSSAISPWRLALWATAGYGFSQAFIEQATNANEPLVGVLWSFLAMLFAALSFKVKSNWPIVVSGLLFSLAMATYQSTLLLAPAAIVLMWQAGSQEHKYSLFNLRLYFRIGLFALSGFIGCMLIYGWAYRVEGVTNPAEMVKRFFVPQMGVQVTFGASFGKLMNVPVGLVRNVFPVLENYFGIRHVLAGPKLSLASFLLLLVLFCGFLAFCFAQLFTRWNSLSPSARTGAIAAAVGLVFTGIPLIVWEPNYDKLWLQPLACLAYLLAVALNAICEEETRASFLLPKVAALVLLAVVISNSVRAVNGHRHGTAGLQEAQQLAQNLGKEDFVVGDWDNMAILYGDIWSPEGQYLDFPWETILYGRSATAHLRDAVLKTREKGGRVYFLGVVDESKQEWDAYIGSKCGVPFSDLDFYRRSSHVVTKFRINGAEISLSQLDAAGLN
jgi:hypothetical protein